MFTGDKIFVNIGNISINSTNTLTEFKQKLKYYGHNNLYNIIMQSIHYHSKHDESDYLIVLSIDTASILLHIFKINTNSCAFGLKHIQYVENPLATNSIYLSIDYKNDNLYVFYQANKTFQIFNLKTKKWDPKTYKYNFCPKNKKMGPKNIFNTIWKKVYLLLVSMGLISNPWFIALTVSSIACFIMTEYDLSVII
eukprot:335252_1